MCCVCVLGGFNGWLLGWQMAMQQQFMAGGGCDAHFIVHLFVTAIADGNMQQDAMAPKTWDVLQQVGSVHGLLGKSRALACVCAGVPRACVIWCNPALSRGRVRGE